MQVNFESDPRQQYLNLLGYSQSMLKSKVTDAMKKMQLTTQPDNQQTTVSYFSTSWFRTSSHLFLGILNSFLFQIWTLFVKFEFYSNFA